MSNKNDLKVEGKQVLWFNGLRWLVKETCETHEEALTKLTELNALD